VNLYTIRYISAETQQIFDIMICLRVALQEVGAVMEKLRKACVLD